MSYSQQPQPARSTVPKFRSIDDEPYIEYQRRRLYNRTPHDLHFVVGDVKITLPSPNTNIDGEIEAKINRDFKLTEKEKIVDYAISNGVEADGSESTVRLPVVVKSYSNSLNVPEEVDNVGYICAMMVASADFNSHRYDLFAPNTGFTSLGSIRKAGVVVGAGSLVQYGPNQ